VQYLLRWLEKDFLLLQSIDLLQSGQKIVVLLPLPLDFGGMFLLQVQTVCLFGFQY
jgi:hypothetical protein